MVTTGPKVQYADHGVVPSVEGWTISERYALTRTQTRSRVKMKLAAVGGNIVDNLAEWSDSVTDNFGLD